MPDKLERPTARDPLAALKIPVDGPPDYASVRLDRRVYDVLVLLQAQMTMSRGFRPSLSAALAAGLLKGASQVFAEGVLQDDGEEDE